LTKQNSCVIINDNSKGGLFMYNEERERFTLRDVILQISFVVLFVFLLLWLFPTRNYVDKVLKPIDQAIFNENVKTMSDAAKNYFTLQRLPEDIGDKVTITLRDMLDKKLVLPFAENGSEICDANKSYVEVTKLDEEYAMKVYLECGNDADYIIVHLGCYDYCETTLCEVEKPTKPVVTPTKPTKPVTPVKVYEFEYKKTTGGYWTDWSAYSAWSTTRQTTSDTRREDTETRSEFSHYKEIKTGTYERSTLVGYAMSYDTKQVTTNSLEFTNEKTVNTQVISGYRTVGTGTYVRGSFVKTDKYYSRQTSTNLIEYANEKIGSEQYISGYETQKSESLLYKERLYTSPQVSTSTTRYQFVTNKYIGYSCSGCDGIGWVYNVYTISSTQKPVYSNRTTYTYDVYNKVEATKQEAIYTTKTTYTYDVYNRKEIIKQEAVNKNVTYYRYQTRTYLNGTVSIKWSRSQTDKSLLDQGYSLTGNKREYKNSNV
jgi:hypothetical protein